MPRIIPRDERRAALSPEDRARIRLDFIKDKILRDFTDINGWEIKHAHYYGPDNYKFLDKKWRRIKIGEKWGGPDVTGFFRKKVSLPGHYKGKIVVLDMYVGGEGQLWVNKKAYQGMDFFRKNILLTQNARGNERYEFEIESYVRNRPYEEGGFFAPADRHVLEKARFAVLDREIEAYYFDAKVVFDVFLEQYNNPELETFLFENVAKSLGMVDYYEEDFDKFKKTVMKAGDYLRRVVYGNKSWKSLGSLSAIGNAHLDFVYLWPYKETIRKNARTTTNALSLIREYPDFCFAQSQPRLYKDLKNHYPGVFDEVKEKIKQGKWEAIGGMYIEPDCNLLSGESFIRQFLFGRRFFRKELGVDTDVCWIPDVFGCMWTMPQILRKCGIRFLTTIKLHVWNDTNYFPHDTFWWEGPDDSRLLVHFPPTHFGKGVAPEYVKKHWDNYRQKMETGESLYLYGWSDGGGGPTKEMVEYARRLKSFPGMPAIKMEFAHKYFSRIWKKADNLPVWKDEFYLEAHRGTYTSQGMLKKYNRKSELLYRDAEILSSLAGIFGFAYNQRELNDGWEYILFHQFHDTLPGTHLAETSVDVEKDYKKVLAIGSREVENALAGITSSINFCGYSAVVFNTLSWKRTDIARMKVGIKGGFEIRDDEGKTIPYQITGKTGKETEILFEATDTPQFGYRAYGVVPGKSKISEDPDEFSVSATRMENRFFRIGIDRQGDLASIYDKVNSREVLAPGAVANKFQLFEDKPGNFSAWDIVASYKEVEWQVGQLKSIEVNERGPVRISVRVVKKCLSSQIRQNIILYRNIPRIDFETEINWKEREKLLKTAFPVDITSTFATYDIPFGNIQRPTHKNTSWDKAKFEVCGHKWADLSEGNYGVSILNDCKYGYDISGNVMRLTLLKGPVKPNPVSDLGIHHFTYSLYPHSGSWRDGRVMRAAYELNCPSRACVSSGKSSKKKKLPLSTSFVRVENENVILETLKKAEDGNELIARFFEAHGTRGNVNVKLFKDLIKVSECNLVEEGNVSVKFTGNHFSFYIKPYEIKTFKVKMKNRR